MRGATRSSKKMARRDYVTLGKDNHGVELAFVTEAFLTCHCRKRQGVNNKKKKMSDAVYQRWFQQCI